MTDTTERFESVAGLLTRIASERPDQLAIWAEGATLTYGELLARARALAGGLRARGLRTGERVALLMPNIAEAFVAYFGVALAGGVLVPLNTRLQTRELAYAVRKVGAGVLLCVDGFRSARFLPAARALLAGAPEVSDPALGVPPSRLHDVFCLFTEARPADYPELGDFAALLADGAAADLPAVDPQADWLIQMTSGTTAFPKAAVLGHTQCVRMGTEIGRRMELRGDDRYFVCNPIYHLGCSNFALLAAVSVGASYYTLATFEAGPALAAMAEQRCTVQHGIASHYLLELACPTFDAAALSLRTISVGGGSAVAKQVYDQFKCEGVLQRYGATESGGAPIVCGRYDPLEQRLNTNGRPLPGVELGIADPESGELLAAGRTGEVVLRGWSIMRRYDGDPEITAQTIRPDGWLRSGDLGYVDPNGNLVFQGRLKDVLRVGGEMVASEEVESVIVDHPAVQEAHVVPLADPRYVEVPAAFVVLRGGERLDAAELSGFLDGRLAKFKWPRRVWLVPTSVLPQTGNGKVQKVRLRGLAAELAERSAAGGGAERLEVEVFDGAAS